MHPESAKRLTDWLTKQPDSRAKEIAKEVADIWKDQGEAVAKETFNKYCRNLNLVLWERNAIADMISAFHVLNSIH